MDGFGSFSSFSLLFWSLLSGPARDFDDASLELGRHSRPAENVTDPSSLDKFESRDSLADMLSGPLDCGVQCYYWKRS